MQPGLSADHHTTITDLLGVGWPASDLEEGTDTCECLTRRSTRQSVGMSCGDGGMIVLDSCPRQEPDQIHAPRSARLAAEMPIKTTPQWRARRQDGPAKPKPSTT